MGTYSEFLARLWEVKEETHHSVSWKIKIAGIFRGVKTHFSSCCVFQWPQINAKLNADLTQKGVRKLCFPLVCENLFTLYCRTALNSCFWKQEYLVETGFEYSEWFSSLLIFRFNTSTLKRVRSIFCLHNQVKITWWFLCSFQGLCFSKWQSL